MPKFADFQAEAPGQAASQTEDAYESEDEAEEAPAKTYPAHDLLKMPALSPTMTKGYDACIRWFSHGLSLTLPCRSIAKWLKKVVAECAGESIAVFDSTA